MMGLLILSTRLQDQQTYWTNEVVNFEELELRDSIASGFFFKYAGSLIFWVVNVHGRSFVECV